MRLCLTPFQVPKEGSSPDENEDAYAFNQKMCRLAVTDGASDGFASGLWAKLLAEAFVRSPPPRFTPGTLRSWLRKPIRDWENSLPWDRFTYFQHEKAKQGAYSSFLGLTFKRSLMQGRLPLSKPSYTWSALAVGDTCLFQIRDSKMVSAFPSMSGDSFTDYPALLSTRSEYNVGSIPRSISQKGICSHADLFLLMTDALAAWCYRRLESGSSPWQELLAMSDASSFAVWVAQLRSRGEVRNDDVTLLVASLSSSISESRE